jgi:hypothetical protein
MVSNKAGRISGYLKYRYPLSGHQIQYPTGYRIFNKPGYPARRISGASLVFVLEPLLYQFLSKYRYIFCFCTGSLSLTDWMEPSYSGETFWKGKLQYRMVYTNLDNIYTAYLSFIRNFHRVRFVFNFPVLVNL